jgi:hypothetical protein
VPSPPAAPMAPAPRPVSTGRQRVFISHSSKNKPLADAVARHLEANGIACWIAPRDIKPGANYGVALLDGLSSCQAVLLLLTDDSNRSQFVMKEAERAVSRKIPILVARFQPVAVSRELEFYISTSQFLEATAPPPQQHFNGILASVRDILAAADAPGSVSIVATPRGPRAAGGWGVFVAGLGLLAAAVIAAGVFTAPRIGRLVSGVSTPDPQPTEPPAPGPSTPSSAPTPSTDSPVAGTTRPPVEFEHPKPEPEPPRRPSPGGDSSLEAAVAAKTRAAGALASLAESRLANFHREAFTITKGGTLAPGNVTASDVELLASCRIEPNMKSYSSMAGELIRLLDTSALHKGVITSDGLKTSERYGHDARPRIQELRNVSLASSGSLLDIFASDAHEDLVRTHTTPSGSRYLQFPTAYFVYDEKVSADDAAGIRSLRWGEWSGYVNQQNTGVVVVLESAKNSFRHTTWRWFHVPPPDWAIISSKVPRRMRCVLALTDASGAEIESDYYPLQQFGVTMLEHERIMVLSPFFVDDDFEHYVPEITLTKSIVVLADQVKRVKDFTATIDEVPGKPE